MVERRGAAQSSNQETGPGRGTESMRVRLMLLLEAVYFELRTQHPRDQGAQAAKKKAQDEANKQKREQEEAAVAKYDPFSGSADGPAEATQAADEAERLSAFASTFWSWEIPRTVFKTAHK
ncbi:hypothetical protein KVR01_011812 [Diaporthe batatas]|uniref:uncharacterized protein n=1 Tax=Diaporthe batatas TaxID=748121 RepID=UPI001D05AC90|nr:uncharacterized protein KVR01_011812 [Diaporthe batatas]KAG8158051.1 hypothetical protein KVR01_011812 [Diaporthe batatas]